LFYQPLAKTANSLRSNSAVSYARLLRTITARINAPVGTMNKEKYTTTCTVAHEPANFAIYTVLLTRHNLQPQHRPGHPAEQAVFFVGLLVFFAKCFAKMV